MSRLPLFQGIDIPSGLESYIKYLLIKQQDPELVTRILTVVIDNTDHDLLLKLLYQLMNQYYNIVTASIATISIVSNVIDFSATGARFESIGMNDPLFISIIPIIIDNEGVIIE